MPRTGRPTDDRKEIRLQFRLSVNDIELLEYCCTATRMSKAEVIRKGIRKVYEEIKAE